MTILTVVRDVCAAVGVTLPSAVFPGINSNRTMQEMTALATEVAQRMAYDTREWSVLKTSVIYPGDGIATAFSLPANYKRMLLTGEVWRSTSTQQPMRFIPDTDEWMQRRANGDEDAWGEWTMYGGQIHIWPIMAIGVTARHAYLDKNCIALASGGFGDRFMADGDSYRLDERLLKLNLTWNWKSHKGSPYAEDMGTYTDALAMASGADGPAAIIIGRTPVSWNARVAYPWAVTGPPVWPL